ncbi:hypothetical protein MKP08_05880 [Erythrobacter sp. LQ02-29]|uniref:hypothetical protein n=1 Tax=Erythrobacter sp. LQ02-29 TaxID=2920384 RepID=UPI001F4D7C68|nr:hypothetical protein [Erythrobacter sp. LQ02-29]MCP9222274.1 hypothetical protein [Erythrobacter sp. LQ02-29]
MDFHSFLRTRLGQASLASMVAMTVFALSHGSFVQPGMAIQAPAATTWIDRA